MRSFVGWRNIHADRAVIHIAAICRAVNVPRHCIRIFCLCLPNQPLSSLRKCLVFQGAMGLPLPSSDPWRSEDFAVVPRGLSPGAVLVICGASVIDGLRTVMPRIQLGHTSNQVVFDETPEARIVCQDFSGFAISEALLSSAVCEPTPEAPGPHCTSAMK